MKAMRVVKGKVVGNTVVLEGVLPEGSSVEVREVGEEDEDGWDLTDEEWAEMDESLGEAERGEVFPADVVLAELRALK